MSLQSARDKAFEVVLLGKDLDNEASAVHWFGLWLEALKQWEADETFERAFSENRMCLRAAPVDPSAQKKQSYTPAPNSVKKPDDVTIRAAVGHIPLYQKPENFLTKQKNALGLHDVSAVLMTSEKNITEQVFPKVGRQPVFIPIPYEKDLLLLHGIEHLAKEKKAGPIYDFYKNARARITRIKYGSDDDMKTTFLKVVGDDKRVHYRYGDAHETGGPVAAHVLQERRQNALFYNSRVLTGKITDNNEVTVKIRQHAGGWPQAAVPGPATKKDTPQLPYDVPAEHFLMVGFDGKFKGLIDNTGHLVKR